MDESQSPSDMAKLRLLLSRSVTIGVCLCLCVSIGGRGGQEGRWSIVYILYRGISFDRKSRTGCAQELKGFND